MEIVNGDAIGWVNKTFKRKRNRLYLSNTELKDISLSGKTLGQYLYDDCRNAIAHIKRKPGKRRIKLEKAEDTIRIRIGTRIAKEFSKLYIKDELKLDKRMFLVRKRGTGFPIYLPEKELKRGLYKMAYER